MLHAKTLIADHDWARVGSSNLNVSSLFGNYELDLIAEQDGLTATLATQFLHDMAQSREIVLMARRRLPPRLVDTAAVHPSPALGVAHAHQPAPLPPPHRRTLRERQAAAAVALIQAATGARRMLAGTAAVAFALVGVALILFPLVSSAVIAIGALAAAVSLAGYAGARRRRRRESDAR
jgi:cardiolipin synthase